MNDKATNPADRQLSPRELQVIHLLVEGLRNEEIATELRISRRTVQAHVASIMEKTGKRSRTKLAVHALRARLVPLHDDQHRCEGGELC